MYSDRVQGYCPGGTRCIYFGGRNKVNQRTESAASVSVGWKALSRVQQPPHPHCLRILSES
eukprot:1503472-Rhodomonas_salina.3